MTQEQDKAGTKIIEGMTEALAVAKGEKPAAAIWHNGHRYVPEAEIDRLKSELEHARERNLTANYRADCAHAEVEKLKAELEQARAKAFEEAAKLIDEGFDRGIRRKQDMCSHGKFGWEDCESCASIAIRSIAEAEGKEG